MDVIGFACVSLGSSTVQLHDSLGSKCACTGCGAGLKVKMANVLMQYTTVRAAFSCAFLVGKRAPCKGYSQRNVSCLRWSMSRKAFYNWAEKCSQRPSKVADDAWPGRPVEITTEADVQRMEEFGGFWRAGNAMGQVYECWWRIRREIRVKFFQIWI
jgi:hypothetical protein